MSLGSVSTGVRFQFWFHSGMIPKPVARILLCAILSDTLKLGKDKDILNPD